MTEEHTAFVDGQQEPIVDFPWHEMDRSNPITAEIAGANNGHREYREAALLFLDELSRMLAFIVAYEHPRLAAYTIADAMGWTTITGGLDKRQLGSKLGVGKAAVSKCVKQVQSRFGRTIQGITPMLGQKSIQACQKYSKSRKKNLV